MPDKNPMAELQPQFSSDNATPIPWAKGREHLEVAEIYWLSTVRPDGRPHVTPLQAIWVDDALYFCTGPDERKAKNLMLNSQCILTTGCNTLSEGLDVVVEGNAVKVSDEAALQRVADAYESKYGSDWHFAVRDNAFQDHGGNIVLLYQVTPKVAFGFGRGDSFSQTRWRF